MSPAMSDLPNFKEVTAIPPKDNYGRGRGAYSGLSAKIRSLLPDSGFEFDRPEKKQEQSLRSLVCAISRSNGCEYTVRISNDRQTIGVYRVK